MVPCSVSIGHSMRKPPSRSRKRLWKRLRRPATARKRSSGSPAKRNSRWWEGAGAGRRGGGGGLDGEHPRWLGAGEDVTGGRPADPAEAGVAGLLEKSLHRGGRRII